MATLLAVDESSGTTGQTGVTSNDILLGSGGLALPVRFSQALATDTKVVGTPIAAALSGVDGTAANANGTSVLSFGPNVTDVAFTDANGAEFNGTDSGLRTIDGQRILLYTAPDNNVVIGYAETSPGVLGNAVFALYLDANGTTAAGSDADAGATSAKLWIVQYSPIFNTNTAPPAGDTGPNDIEFLSGVLNVKVSTFQQFSIEGAPSGQNLFLMFGDGTPSADDVAIVVTGKNPNVVDITKGDTVNTGQGGGGTTIGTNNQMVDKGEGMYFTFVKGANPNFTVPNLDQNEADLAANIDFDSFHTATGAQFAVVQTQPTKGVTMLITAINEGTFADGAAMIAGLTPSANELVNITTVTITRMVKQGKTTVEQNYTFTEGAAPPSQDGGISIDFDGGGSGATAYSAESILLTGLLAGDVITYGSGSHNRVLIENYGNSNSNLNSSFDIGKFRLTTATATPTPLQDVAFVDDGPTAALSANPVPTLTVDETVLATNASASFAGNFTTTFGTDGAGSGGGISYALSAVAGPSGLTDTASGEAVNLSVTAGGVVEGRTATGGLLVFSVSVNSTGTVTLDQVRAVVHADATNPDDSRTLSSADLVKLTATATDKDNDPASATLNIGTSLVFKDDGPSVTVNANAVPVLTVDETVLTTNASASFAGNFTSAFGADGAGSGGIGYALSAVAGPSGLTDTATGLAVNLSVTAGGVVEGRTAGTNLLVFSVSVDSTGTVTLDQVRAVVHADTTNADDSRTLSSADLVKLTASITDKDGDPAAATLNIGTSLVFKDDGPAVVLSAQAVPTLTVDDSNFAVNASASFAANFTPTFGADGAGSGTGIGYALSVVAGASGLTDTASGQAVNLSVTAGGVVEGRTATSGLLVFAVSVDSTGTVTLDQSRAVVHADTTNPDDSRTLSSADLVKLTATATDKDGDHAAATLNIGTSLVFKDDGPSLAVNNIVGTGSTLAQTGYWSSATGNDGLGAAGLNVALTSFTLVTPTNTQIPGTFVFNESASSPDGSGNYQFTGTLTGDFDNNASTPNQSVDFSMTFFPDGHYNIHLVQGFASSITTSTANGGLGAGGPDPVQTLVIPKPPATPVDSVVFFSAIPNASDAQLLDGVVSGATDKTEAQLQTNPLPAYIDARSMNVSTSGIGVGNNLLEGDTSAVIGGTDESFVVNPGIEATSIEIKIDNSVGGYSYSGGERMFYKVVYSDGTVSAYVPVEVDLGLANKGQPTSFVINGGGKLIDAVQLTMAKGDVKIPEIIFSKQTENLANDVMLQFSASYVDKDGDTASDTFNVNLYANEVNNQTLNYLLAGTGSADAFNIDLAGARNKYQVADFTVGTDKLVLIGDAAASVAAPNNGGADSIVTITESGGQTTTITVLGVDLSNADILFG